MKANENTTPNTDPERDLFAENWRETAGDRPRRTPRKRGRILPAIVFALALTLCSLLGVLFLAWHDGTPHLNELKVLEEVQQREYTALIQSAAKPEGWDDGLFAKLQQSALDAYDKTRLNQIEQALDGDAAAKDALENAEGASDQSQLEAWKNLFANPSAYPMELLTLAAADQSLIPFVLDYPSHVNDTGQDVDLTVDLSAFPDLKTSDPAWGYAPYAQSMMVLSGAAPTAIADVFSYLLKDPAITPLRIAQLSADSGYDTVSSILDGSIFANAALTYGVSMNPLNPYKTQVNEAVDLGDIVIAAAGDENNPTILVIPAKDENGNWMVYSPASGAPAQAVDPDTIKDSLLAVYSFWTE